MYNWGGYVLNLIMIVVTMWMVNKFLGIFFEKKKVSIFSIGTWILYALYQVIVESCWGNASLWITLISMVLVFGIAISNYQGIMKNFVFAILLFHVVWAIIEMLVFYYLRIGVVDEKSFSLLGAVISKIIMILGVYFLSLYEKRKYDETVPVKYYLALMFVPLGSIYIAVNEFYVKQYINNMFSGAVTFSILLLLNIVIFEIYAKLLGNMKFEREKTAYVQQLDMMGRNMEEQRKIMEEFHEEKHNLINEMIVLKDSVENSGKERVIENINRIIKVCDVSERVSDSGNAVVDAIINFKYAVAKEKGILFQLKIFIPEELPIDRCDIGVVLGNALDNAIEAVNVCTAREKIIDIFMGVKKQMLVIVIKNAYEHSIKRDLTGELLSTKKEAHRHGYGVKSISKIAKRYQGEVLVDTMDNMFELTVTMNLQEM